MSPWNKDRPPVHLKNTCEFARKIWDSGKYWIKRDMFVAVLLIPGCSPCSHAFLQFLFSMQQILIVIQDLLSSVTKGLLSIFDPYWF